VRTSIRRASVAGFLCLTLLSACTKDKNNDLKDAAPSPGASGSASPGGGAAASPTALSAGAIADKIGCTDRVPGTKAATDPVTPVEAVDCKIGDVRYSIRTYASNADRDKAVDAAPTDGGYRNIGERWLVATDNQAAANNTLAKVGGTIVDLRYVTPGS
jgi:hypothetical protein